MTIAHKQCKLFSRLPTNKSYVEKRPSKVISGSNLFPSSEVPRGTKLKDKILKRARDVEKKTKAEEGKV